MASFLMVLPVAMVMGLGALFRRIRFLDDETVLRLNSMLYWAALPAFIFRSILGVGREILSNSSLFWALHVSFLLVPAVALVLGRLFTTDRKRLAVSVLTSIRSNNVFMGVPAVMIAMGQPGVEAVSLYLAVGLLGYHFFSVTWAQVVLSGRTKIRSLFDTLEQLLKNPLILACLMGVAGALMGFDKLPYWLDAAVKMVGNTGSGIALIALGASIRFENLGEAMKSTWRDCLFKLFISPALILGVLLAWSIDPLLRNAVVLVSAMPAAVNSFVLAHNMGMDYDYAGKIVTLSTALSVFSLPVWVWLLGI